MGLGGGGGGGGALMGFRGVGVERLGSRVYMLGGLGIKSLGLDFWEVSG